eukprot:COSAG05_NODE_4667_length_1417_cov_3.247344_1_plen_117_part_00
MFYVETVRLTLHMISNGAHHQTAAAGPSRLTHSLIFPTDKAQAAHLVNPKRGGWHLCQLSSGSHLFDLTRGARLVSACHSVLAHSKISIARSLTRTTTIEDYYADRKVTLRHTMDI